MLITRPEPAASELAEALRGDGLEPLVAPAFSFEPLAAAIDTLPARPDEGRRLAVFCSPRAVEFGLRQLPAGFLDDATVAAIGPATGEALERSGRPADLLPGPPFTSESMLEEPGLRDAPGKALLFTAPGGRQALFDGLTGLGWDVAFAHVYRALPMVPPEDVSLALQDERGRLVSVWTSARALQIFQSSLAPGAWARVCQGDFVVTSRRLAEAVPGEARGRIETAAAPGNDAIRMAVLVLAGAS